MEKTKQMSTRFTEAEFAEIKKCAESVGLSASEYMRCCTINKGHEHILDPEVWDAIAHMHEDSRQIAMEISEAAKKCDDSFNSQIFIKFANEKVHELNKKIAYIELNLKEFNGELDNHGRY